MIIHQQKYYPAFCAFCASDTPDARLYLFEMSHAEGFPFHLFLTLVTRVTIDFILSNYYIYYKKTSIVLINRQIHIQA